MGRHTKRVITAREVYDYVESGGSCCPKCKSRDIADGSVDVDGNWHAVDVVCNGCDMEWRDIYTLAFIL